MPLTLQRQTGSGPVGIGPSQVYARWEYETEEADDGTPVHRRWTVRVSLDEFESLGLMPYQWVRVHLPGRGPVRAFFAGSRDEPPYAHLRFER